MRVLASPAVSRRRSLFTLMGLLIGVVLLINQFSRLLEDPHNDDTTTQATTKGKAELLGVERELATFRSGNKDSQNTAAKLKIKEEQVEKKTRPHTKKGNQSSSRQKSANAPTVSPTPKPKRETALPTVSPTTSPTVSPTASPTAASTAASTASPTASPTSKATLEPTVKLEPTASPTTKLKPTTSSIANEKEVKKGVRKKGKDAPPRIKETTSPTMSPTTKPAKEETKGSDKKSNGKVNSSKNKGPLNVIIFYPDDWRHDHLGGVSPIVQTPFLNQLAREGIRFTHNMVTTSVCWISRASFFSGQYASRHKSFFLKFPHFYDTWNTTSWPALLQKAGYYVGHIGKWQYVNPDGFVDRLFNYSHFFEGWHIYRNRYNVDVARDDTFEFLEKRPKDKPFALTIAYYPPKAVGDTPEPGSQWQPKPETRPTYYENVTIPVPPYDVNASWNKLPWFFPKDGMEGRRRWESRYNTTEQFQEGMKNYYGLITDVDASIKEVVDELKRQDLMDNTLILFTADNGLFHAEHGLAGKWYPYQESIRIPLIIRDPRMPADKVNTLNDALTFNVDLAPTILGAAGIKIPPEWQGRDIADLYLKEPLDPSPWRTEVFYEFPLRRLTLKSSAVVRHDVKYIFWPKHKYGELFNLTEDPFEQNNVWGDPTYASILEELKERHEILKAEFTT